jgi:hypothetical protein
LHRDNVKNQIFARVVADPAKSLVKLPLSLVSFRSSEPSESFDLFSVTARAQTSDSDRDLPADSAVTVAAPGSESESGGACRASNIVWHGAAASDGDSDSESLAGLVRVSVPGELLALALAP